MREKAQSFQTIQALRLVAAASVALTHVSFYIKTRIDQNFPVWEIGSQGVQIFFVISGFVMALTSGALSGSPVHWRQFLVRRLTRVVPLYWLMNLIKLLTLMAVPGALLAKPDLWNVILSLLFIPSRNENGLVETFYGVGWTLNFEMFFYIMIAVLLLLRRPVVRYSVVMLVVLVIAGWLRRDDWPAVTYLLHPYLANFVCGLLIAQYAKSNDINRPWLGLLLCAVASYFIFLRPIHPTMMFFGLQYASLVLGLVMLESTFGNKIPRFVLFGGDASYSLYLTHAMVGPLTVVAAAKIGFSSTIGIFIITSAVIYVAACVCFTKVERPIGIFLSSRLR